MRMLLTVSIPASAGNAAARAGKLGSSVEKILADLKPEAAYFYAERRSSEVAARPQPRSDVRIAGLHVGAPADENRQVESVSVFSIASRQARTRRRNTARSIPAKSRMRSMTSQNGIGHGPMRIAGSKTKCPLTG